MTLWDEVWSRMYRYKVASGIKVATMNLSKHLPSHMSIAGHRVLVSYEGQPSTCYGCGDTGDMHQDCPNRRREMNTTMEPNACSCAHILTNGPENRGVADAEESVTVGPSAPCGKPQEHQVETPAPVHFPEQASTARDQADSSV
jgi:hypothetical protein